MNLFFYSDLNLSFIKSIIKKEFYMDSKVFFNQVKVNAWEEAKLDLENSESKQNNIAIFWLSRSYLIKLFLILQNNQFDDEKKFVDKTYNYILKNLRQIKSLGVEVVFINPGQRFITSQDYINVVYLNQTLRFWDSSAYENLEANGIKVIYESDFSNVNKHSHRLWYLSKNPFAIEYLKIMGKEIVKQIKFLNKPIKVLAFDLDDTIWGGVLGEDGIDGIRLGGHDQKGELFQDIQRVILNIKSKGIIIGALSKNNQDEVEDCFKKHNEMLIKKEDLGFLICNWQEKYINLINVSKKLSLGLDSFAFLDNSNVEREKMVNFCPEVFTIDLPKDEYEWATYLKETICFPSLITNEDILRKDHYKLENIREKEIRKYLKKEPNQTNEDKIYSILGVRVEEQKFDLIRTHQLFIRTNQFNLSSRRLNKEQITNIKNDDKFFLKLFRVKDNFGDYGICAVFSAEIKENQLNVYDFMISCRALGRGVEDFIFDKITLIAKNKKLKKILFNYVKTGKNIPILNFLIKKGVSIETNQLLI